MARARPPRDSRRVAGAPLVFPQAVNSCPSRAYRPERSPEPRLKPVQVSCCRGASEDARFPQKSSHQRLHLTMNSRFPSTSLRAGSAASQRSLVGMTRCQAASAIWEAGEFPQAAKTRPDTNRLRPGNVARIAIQPSRSPVCPLSFASRRGYPHIGPKSLQPPTFSGSFLKTLQTTRKRAKRQP